MSKIMDADPVAVDGISKKPNPWFQFVGRVRALTGLAQPDAMRLASELRAEKAIETWTDAEVAPRGIKWLRQNYMVMTEQTLKAKIDAITALKEKAAEIDAMAAEIAEFKKREFITPKSNPLMVAALGKFAEYCEKTVPKQLSDAAEELFKTAAQEDSYDTAMEIPDTIREKMLEIMSLDLKLAEEAEKAVAKASKEEKAAEKAAAKAEKAAAKAAKDTAKAEKSAGGKKKEAAAAAAGAGTEEPALSIEDARRKGVPKHIKTLVWNKYVGAAVNSTKCMCCREELISIRSFHCGHVKAASKGGDCTINNLRPICAACNGSMGTMSMNEFTMTYFGWEV